MNVVGIDPGRFGALAVLDGDTQSILGIWDMPMTVALNTKNSKRARINHLEIRNMAVMFATIFSVRRAIIENVWGQTSDGAAGAFVFGEGFGAVTQAMIGANIEIELVTSGVWKRDMRMPKDKNFAVGRADQLFTLQQQLFRGPMGGLQDGRAEAAVIALWWLQRGHRG